MSTSSNKPKFDPLRLISQVISYAKHTKLMLLMLAFGLLIGIAAFMFATPTYRSVALLSMQNFIAPVGAAGVEETNPSYGNLRSLTGRLESSSLQLTTAKRMGLLGEGATSEDLVKIISAIRIRAVDARGIELTVLAYDPVVTRSLANELVATYQQLQQKNYEEYRSEGLRRYGEQVERLEAEISETMASLSSVAREQKITEVTLEQESLLNIPKQLIETRERLARMSGVREALVTLESRAQTPGEPTANAGSGGNISNMISLLSLLSSFEDDTEVELGDVVALGPREGTTVRSTKGRIVMGNLGNPSELESIEPWRKLEKDRRILLDQIKQISGVYLPGHRAIKDLELRLDATERGLETEFKMLRQKFDFNYASLEEKEKRLQARMPEYYAINDKVERSTRDYSAIAAKQKMWDQARDRLATTLDVITFAKDFDWIELRYQGLISRRDDVPVSPNKFKIAIIGLVVGVAGAFGAPTVLNLLDTSASTVAGLEQVTGLTGIGIVPMTSKATLEDVNRSPAQGATVPNYLLECFRIIRANIIMHPNRHNRSQVVLVTSARPQEGKTTLASNLAWAFQSMGEKTLLLDCDLRRGRVHGVTGIDNRPGMTRLLLGECTIGEAIQSVGPGGFDVIPRGPVIAGTTDLLCQKVFHDLLKQFRGSYDRVVIDAPPALGLSETSSLQQVVDGTVIVVRAETTGRKDVLDAISLLKRTQAHFFGFVLNAVDLSKLSNYYNYYYYSAPYYDQVEVEAEPARLANRRV
jgi:succinoglycan biosynthesis transport protein ExoP